MVIHFVTNDNLIPVHTKHAQGKQIVNPKSPNECDACRVSCVWVFLMLFDSRKHKSCVHKKAHTQTGYTFTHALQKLHTQFINARHAPAHSLTIHVFSHIFFSLLHNIICYTPTMTYNHRDTVVNYVFIHAHTERHWIYGICFTSLRNGRCFFIRLQRENRNHGKGRQLNAVHCENQ